MAAPHKWLQYTCINNVIEGTRFVPFKTPYKNPVQRPQGGCEIFNTRDLLRKCRNLGIIFNLAKTDRYYFPTLFKKKNIEYYHYKLDGGGRVPHPDQQRKAFSKMDQFIAKNPHNTELLIGVHCTHGVNRTGYLICRYMIERLGIEPADAIARFERGRGHPFDHIEYVEDLKKLRADADPRAVAWHSIGGKIIQAGKDDQEEDDAEFDFAALERLRQRRENNRSRKDRQKDTRSPPRNVDDVSGSGHSERSAGARRSRRKRNRSRRHVHREYSRSPVQYSRNHPEYSNQPPRMDRNNDPFARYLGPRQAEHHYSNEQLFGPRERNPYRWAGYQTFSDYSKP